MTTESLPKLTVPQFLYGELMSDAHKQWKRVARKIVKTGSWEAGLEGINVLDFKDVKGDFACDNASKLLFIGENLWINGIFEILSDACADRWPENGDWSPKSQEFVVSGLNYFWFASAFCVTGAWLGEFRSALEKRASAKLIIPKLLKWWPILCIFDRRFSHGQKTGDVLRGWPLWAGGLAKSCSDLGVPRQELEQLSKVNPVEAGVLAAAWLQEFGADESDHRTLAR